MKYNLENKNNSRWNRQRNVIWFNPPFSQTNAAKRVLDLLDKHFPLNYQLYKIFSRNTVKVSYYCTHDVSSIIKLHNKKLIKSENKLWKKGRISKGLKTSYKKCVVTATGHTRKAYLDIAEDEFKQRYCNYKKSFTNWKNENETSLSKYI